ncbi:MAG TPA: hypothetical protein VFQ14_01550 [Thermoleophilaceae bacterium]|nr:hypothetical protein [Thermoleophilaceae bacterium]
MAYVVIGGFSVVANGYLRATEDSDLLVPDGPDTDQAIARFLDLADARRLRDSKVLALAEISTVDHLRVTTRHGIVDLLRGGAPPLDFDTVANAAFEIDLKGQKVRIAGLRSVVGFKRLADRPRDRNDLAELESLHGDLPIDPIPGLDS